MDIHAELQTLPLARPLPDGVPDMDHMVTACHEMGHMVGFDAGGFDVSGAWLEHSWFSGDLQGAFTRTEDEPDDDPEAMSLYLVGILAGGEAAAYCIQHYLDTTVGYAYEVAYSGSGDDHTEFAKLKKRARRSSRRLQADTTRLVAKRWRVIERHAPKLVRKRRLAGSAL